MLWKKYLGVFKMFSCNQKFKIPKEELLKQVNVTLSGDYANIQLNTPKRVNQKDYKTQFH